MPSPAELPASSPIVMWERSPVTPAWRQAPHNPGCNVCSGRGWQWADETRIHKEPCDGCGYADLIAVPAAPAKARAA